MHFSRTDLNASKSYKQFSITKFSHTEDIAFSLVLNQFYYNFISILFNLYKQIYKQYTYITKSSSSPVIVVISNSYKQTFF